jgi:hypothetical protein
VIDGENLIECGFAQPLAPADGHQEYNCRVDNERDGAKHNR